jgi:nucleoside-diphosphate-sugar epimerase
MPMERDGRNTRREVTGVAKPRALVIGGTGPTGPFVVEGLHARGYEVTILHGGQHEVEFAVPGVAHIHEDPHFLEGLQRGVAGRTYDLVVAQYGRLRVIAEYFKGRTERLIAIGGATGIFAPEDDERWGRTGRATLFSDRSETYVRDEGPNKIHKIGLRMVQAMETLFDNHALGAYTATYLAYPVNYGARTPGPYDWSIVRRVLDGRRSFVLADGGLKLESRVYSQNAAHAVLLVADNPEKAAGQRYNVADETAFSMRQRVEFVARHLGAELKIVDMPYELAWPCHPLYRHSPEHRLTQSSRIRDELGYVDAVAPDVAYGRYIDWLVENPLTPGGELERQVGDPFQYDAEDELMERWVTARRSIGEIESPLPQQGHQYRHPKKPGEAWAAAPATP